MGQTAIKISGERICLIAGTVFAFLLVSPAAMLSQASDASAQATRNMIPAAPSLPISYGDLIQVNVFDSVELSGPLRVNSKGEVELPLGGAVSVRGLTAAEAGAAIATRLKQAEILLDPHVTVLIIEYQSQGVTVTGEVKTPGVYPLLGNRTVLDMIALAGGLNENAGQIASVFHRDNPHDIRQVKLGVSVLTPSSIAESNFELLPGDTISVSRSGVIYIIGDVGRPGGFLVEHNDRLSVLQALALAQGANQTASLGATQLMRKVEGGRLQYGIDLKKVLKGESPDVLLADGDVLYVPVSYKKVYSLRAIEAMISAGTQIAIFKSYQ
jgi:polysaccharide export outer membrane protein